MYRITRAFGKGWYASFSSPARSFERPLGGNKKGPQTLLRGPFLIRIFSLLIRAIRSLLPFVERPQICRTPLQKAILHRAVEVNCIAIHVFKQIQM